MTAAQNTVVGVADMRSQPKIEPDAVQQQPLPMVGSANLYSFRLKIFSLCFKVKCFTMRGKYSSRFLGIINLIKSQLKITSMLSLFDMFASLNPLDCRKLLHKPT